jgi:hypothetical protein
MSIEQFVADIKVKTDEAEVHRVEIKNQYEVLNTMLQESGGIRTREVDDTYKNIDRLFGIKAKLEAEVRVLKNKLMEIILNA